MDGEAAGPLTQPSRTLSGVGLQHRSLSTGERINEILEVSYITCCINNSGRLFRDEKMPDLYLLKHRIQRVLLEC